MASRPSASDERTTSVSNIPDGEGAHSSVQSGLRVKPDRTNTGRRAFPLLVVCFPSAKACEVAAEFGKNPSNEAGALAARNALLSIVLLS